MSQGHVSWGFGYGSHIITSTQTFAWGWFQLHCFYIAAQNTRNLCAHLGKWVLTLINIITMKSRTIYGKQSAHIALYLGTTCTQHVRESMSESQNYQWRTQQSNSVGNMWCCMSAVQYPFQISMLLIYVTTVFQVMLAHTLWGKTQSSPYPRRNPICSLNWQ